MKEKIKKMSEERENYSKPNYIDEISSKDKNQECYLVKYSRPFLNLNREELKQIGHRRSNILREHWALHPRYDVDRIYVSREE